MPDYRVTIRHGARSHRYHVQDIRAETLREALRAVADGFPDAAADADLIEIRHQVDPDARAFTPE